MFSIRQDEKGREKKKKNKRERKKENKINKKLTGAQGEWAGSIGKETSTASGMNGRKCLDQTVSTMQESDREVAAYL